MRVDCHFPITVRVVGVPDDAQLEELGKALVRVLTDRLAEAERVLNQRLGSQVTGSVTVRERYDPDRDEGPAYRVPSFDSGGKPVNMPVRRTGPPWIVLRSVQFHARIGGFLDLVESLLDNQEFPDRVLYADRYDQPRWIGVWLVRINRDYTLDELSPLLFERAARLSGMGDREVLVSVLAPTDHARSTLIELDLDGVVSAGIPELDAHNARRLDGTGATATLRHGGWALFGFMRLPKVELSDLADLGPSAQLQLPLRDVETLVLPDEFEQRFSVRWSDFASVFGDEQVPVWLQGLTVRRDAPPAAFTLLLDRNVNPTLRESEVPSRRLLVLTDDKLNSLPPSIRQVVSSWTNDATRQASGRGDTTGLRVLYALTVLNVDAERLGTARYRRLARQVVSVLRRWLSGDAGNTSWRLGFEQFLSNQFADPPPQRPDGGTLFEHVLVELSSTELNRLFDIADTSRSVPLRQLLLRLLLATRFAGDPRVVALGRAVAEAVENARRNVYRTDPAEVWLDREAGKAVRVGAVLGDVDSLYVFRRDRKQLTPAKADALRDALVIEGSALVGAVMRGDDHTEYTLDSFAKTVLARAVQRVRVTETDFVTVTVERSMRLRDVRDATVGGVRTVRVQFEFVERIAGQQWTAVGDPVSEGSGDFEARLTYWGLARAGEVYEKAGLVISVVGLAAVALEIGLVGLLVELAGGSTAVLVSIGISELTYLLRVIFGNAALSLRGFLEAALDGYVFALGFRAGGVLGRAAAEAIGTETLRAAVRSWIAQRLVTGVVGGSLSAGLHTFSHDILRVALDGGSFSGAGTYVRQMTAGAVIGVIAEFALTPALNAVLTGGHQGLTTAAEVAARLRSAGWSATEVVAVSTEALANLRATFATFMGDAAASGFAAALASRVSEIAAELGGRELARHVLELSGAQLSITASAGLRRLLPALEATTPQRAHEVARIFSEHPKETPILLEVLAGLDAGAARHLAGGTFGSPGELAAFLGRLARYTPPQQRAALELLGELGIVAETPGQVASPLQRQFAASLRLQATGWELEAAQLRRRAVALREAAARSESHNPRRASVQRNQADQADQQAVELTERAGRARAEADMPGGPTPPELPGPADVEQALSRLEAGMSGPGTGAQTWIRLRGAPFRENPHLLDRVVRPVFRSRSGNRVVFRVEGGTDPTARGRNLVHIDPASGNAQVRSSGKDVNLNFGVFERAIEFLIANRQGGRLVVFEVEEGWFQALRGSAVPEQGIPATLTYQGPGGSTGTLRPPPPGAVQGLPRPVDTRQATDQLQVPVSLVPELNQFIVPGTGRILEFTW